MDDFLFIDKGTKRTNWQIDTFLEVSENIGFPVSEDKTERASTWQVFLGILVDALNQFIGLPEEKIEKGLILIRCLLKKKKATVRQLMAVAGFFNFLSKALIHGRPYIRRIYQTYAPFAAHLNWHVYLNLNVRRDLHMWEQFLTTKPYYRPFVDLLELPAQEVGLATDASGAASLGFGCTYKLQYLSQQWPTGLIADTNQVNPFICWLELYAVATAVALWGHHFKNSRIVMDQL